MLTTIPDRTESRQNSRGEVADCTPLAIRASGVRMLIG
jgi:hypothetical protein